MQLKEREDYSLIQQEMSDKHYVRKWDQIYIMHAHVWQEKKKKTLVVVTDINQYHITLRFPAGFCESMGWHQFEEERMY